ncbi:MAG: hypothetical protein ACRC56_11900 [Bosea sp. (in: a-proteobacteria)]
MAAFRFVGEGSGQWFGRSFETGDVLEFDPDTEAFAIAAASQNPTFKALDAEGDDNEGAEGDGEGKAQLLADLDALGVESDGRWSVERLRKLRDEALGSK